MINWPEKKPCHFSCPDEDGYYCTFCIINATIDACIEAYEKGRLSVEEIDHMLTEHVFNGFLPNILLILSGDCNHDPKEEKG